MNDATLPLDGGDLAYVHGGAGPLIVFAHALGPLAWGPLERLRRTCTVAIPDWEASTTPAETMSGFGWFEALADAHGSGRAALCAWSMAGPQAIHYAALRPAHLDRLILVDVAGLGAGLPELEWRDVPHMILSRIVGHPTKGFVRILWRHWVRNEGVDTAPLVEATHRFFRSGLASPVDPDDEDDEEDELLDRLPSIAVPTLVLAGRHSTVLGPRFGKAAAALLPDARLVVFEESSHTLQLEEPEAFEEALAGFMGEVR